MSDNRALDKALVLVQRLYFKTSDGKVDWEETDNESWFVLNQGNYRLVLKQVPDYSYPDQPDYELEIYDVAADRTIDTITNVTLRPVMDRLTEEGLSPFQLLVRTFAMARRAVLGVDDALETIILGLEEEEEE